MPLEIQVVAESPLTLSADVLVLPVLAGANLKQEPLSYLNEALSGAVAKIVAREEWKAQKEQILEVNVAGVLPFFKVVLYGIGQRGQMTNADWRTYAAKAAQVANAAKATSLVVGVPDGFPPEQLRYLSEGLVLGEYRFNKYLTGERRPKAELAAAAIAIGTKARIGKVHKASVEVGEGVARAVALTRNLVNEPPNELYPARLASEAERMAKEAGLECQIFDRKEIERRGMKLLIAVGQGSVNEPRFIHLVYKPKKAPRRSSSSSARASPSTPAASASSPRPAWAR